MRIGIVGDIHRHWGPDDLRCFDRSELDLLLFVGDLGGHLQRGALDVARSIARLQVPALVVPGNHDAANLGQLLGEVVGSRALIRGFAPGHGGRRDRLERALSPVPLGGYSRHRFGDLNVICGRPHSMGGPSLGFEPLLAQRFGVGSLQESAQRLRALVDEAPPGDLLFVAHNGPTGLGDRREDPWGCDFRKEQGDFGDPDLRAAIDHAQGTGRRVVAVVAGHMHRRLRGGGERRWQGSVDGVLHVNAAVVPRVRSGRRHHVLLRLIDGAAQAEDRWIDDAGGEMD